MLLLLTILCYTQHVPFDSLLIAKIISNLIFKSNNIIKQFLEYILNMFLQSAASVYQHWSVLARRVGIVVGRRHDHWDQLNSLG